MKCAILSWDSEFFGCRVMALEVEEADCADSLAQRLESVSADVVYVYVPCGVVGRLRAPLIRMGGGCYDHRVIYRKTIVSCPVRSTRDPDIQIVRSCTSELQQLAISSGWCSRFRRDIRFRPFFERLYLEWIGKACTAEDEHVLVVKMGGHIVGMTTVVVRGGLGKIGLVAVSEQVRGKHLGRRLMDACDRFLSEQKVSTCEVVTQKENEVACRLYESCGYQLVEAKEIWHVWKGRGM